MAAWGAHQPRGSDTSRHQAGRPGYFPKSTRNPISRGFLGAFVSLSQNRMDGGGECLFLGGTQGSRAQSALTHTTIPSTTANSSALKPQDLIVFFSPPFLYGLGG